MKKGEPVGEWLERQGRVHIRYGDAIELIQEIQAKRDNLGLELSEWVKFGDEVIGMVCDLFDIEKPEVMEMTGEKPIRLAVDPKWIKKLDDIATVTTELTEVLTERVDERAEAIKEVKELEKETEKLGIPPSDLIKYGVLQGGISTLCRLFNIKDEEVNG